MDENLGRTRRSARVVVVEDDDALEELIFAWLARHGLQTVPVRGNTGPRQASAGPHSVRRTGRGITADHVVDLPPDLARHTLSTLDDAGTPTVLIVTSPDMGAGENAAGEYASVEVMRTSEVLTLGEWVNAFRRKAGQTIPAHIRVGPLEIDGDRLTAYVLGSEMRLTPTEFRLLQYLAAHSDRVVGHAELLRSVWSPGYEDDIHLLQQTIRGLRARIAAVTDEQLIESVYGTGYRMADWRASDRARRSTSQSATSAGAVRGRLDSSD